MTIYVHSSQPDIRSSWWRHQMETFSALLALCAGNSLVTSEFPSQRPVTQSFDVFFDLRLNKRLSKQSWGWSFETPSCSLWRHCNDDREISCFTIKQIISSSHMLIHKKTWVHTSQSFILEHEIDQYSIIPTGPTTSMPINMTIWDPSQYKDHLTQVWGFPC